MWHADTSGTRTFDLRPLVCLNADVQCQKTVKDGVTTWTLVK